MTVTGQPQVSYETCRGETSLWVRKGFPGEPGFEPASKDEPTSDSKQRRESQMAGNDKEKSQEG